MARYLFSMFGSEEGYDLADETAIAAEMALHEEFMAAVAAAGATIVATEALEPSATASTVRRGDAEPLITDGPFVDTKEVLGGFYVIDAPDLDVALRLARICPAGVVEVRPVLEMQG